jgi:MoaA/NifB/PqqE/SkfB family radical SAM enzyme
METVKHFPCAAWNYGKEEIEAARLNNQILNCDIELTRHCNLKCKFCYSASGKPLDNELSSKEIKRIISDAKDLGVKTITLTGGEPLLHPNFFEIVDFARSKDIIVQIFSNGTLINSDAAKKLFSYHVFPCVSIESIQAEVHDNMVGVKGTYEKMFQGIKNLIDVGYTKKIPLTINAVITKINYPYLEELWKWADGSGIEPFLLRLIPTGRSLENNGLEVSSVDVKKLVERIAVEKGYSPTVPYFGDGGCRKQYMSCYISSQGFVQPCSGININCGNIRHKSLAEIISNSPILKIMRNIDDEIIGKCSTCNEKSKCYGCRAIAYAVTGDVVESDPLCWH